MDLQYEVCRKRKEFGVHPSFGDTPVQTLFNDFEPEEKCENFKKVHVKTREFQCIPQYSCHAVNTEAFIQKDVAVLHREGGWPGNVNQAQDKERYIRKAEANAEFSKICKMLVGRLKGVTESNLTIDLYKKYFENDDEDFSSDPPHVDTICMVKDPTGQNRPVCKVSWHPESANKFVACYGITEFEKSTEGASALPSYIWDVNQSIVPDFELLPDSPLMCAQFNPKRTEELIGGCYNGVVAFWDTRCGKRPRDQSRIQNSHQDPVYDVAFIQSRSGSEFCSVSTDGTVLWWDAKRLSEPIDRFELIDPETGIKHGGSSLEYRLDAGANKYLVGTETGLVFNVERKAKKDQESQKTLKSIYGKNANHHGPVYSVSRNYAIVKGFMTAGDWGCRMWTEEVKTPNFGTRYDLSLVNASVWSPSRFGVFFAGKANGCLDIWDYAYTQEHPIWSQRIRENPLTCLSVDKSGRFLAVGDKGGETTILRLSNSLTFPGPTEKQYMQQLFEREGVREKILNQALKSKAASAAQIEKKRKAKQAQLDEIKQQNKVVAARFEENLENIERKYLRKIEQNEPIPFKDEYSKFLNINVKANKQVKPDPAAASQEKPIFEQKQSGCIPDPEPVEKKSEPIVVKQPEPVYFPGMYTLTDSCVVTQSGDKNSERVGSVDKGQVHQVMEISNIPGQYRIRGRIASGWITLKDTSSNKTWVQGTGTAAPSQNQKEPEPAEKKPKPAVVNQPEKEANQQETTESNKNASKKDNKIEDKPENESTKSMNEDKDKSENADVDLNVDDLDNLDK